MPQVKKFGTFAGVYTPSVLTILGVIMYMRLGWVVGSAGLYAALAIIIISHVISVSTSLSISSIATDKRIRTGGIYYILSRSLGLPMGGSIGITLFIGTALSISLYIIGFAESFLSLDVVREYTGLSQDVVSYQILGSVILVALTALALISTSLALKVQFYILAAIGLSLVSIGAGIWMNLDLAPSVPLLTPAKDAPSMELIFGIFFPAVTGFTAGVAMSGDLSDPKQSIPKGTLWAVITGFVVYIALTVLFAFFINRDTLVNSSNFITEIAAVSLLVYLGIWGATLSSALGGILGAPRIMQAIASDKIAPKVFAKGKGPGNEPQNALILTFVISELGILLGGDINAIAAVVSMFYLASYAFINVAFTLEKWASTDFRPSFKIPTFIGAVGALAAFILMFRLDPFSMAIALGLMGLIYFLLRRKEIKLEKGDVWQSVWSSVIRTALHRMDKRDIEERNWQPNIILFSGGTSRRPHLIEFGKVLVGRYGVLSNFDLHESSNDEILFPKPKQKILEDTIVPGIFTRRQSCSDIYQGIEMIARTYGFSGVEPNSVLLGWGRTSKDPVRFMETIHTLSELDLNLLMLDFDKGVGFGDYNLIDIWWRGNGRHGNLALNLTRFIWSSAEWRDAKVRLMIVNPSNDATDQIQREAQDVIENMRINADIKVINNEIEQKPFYDIVRAESRETDLIVLDVPDVPTGGEASFVNETSQLMKDLGTVLLIKASSLFKTLNFGVSLERNKPEIFDEDINEIQAFELDRDELPKNVELAGGVLELLSSFSSLSDQFYTTYFKPVTGAYEVFFHSVERTTHEVFDRLEQRVVALEPNMQVKGIRRLQNSFLLKSRKAISVYLEEGVESQFEHIRDGFENLLLTTDELIAAQPERVLENYNFDDLERAAKSKEGLRLWWFIQRKQLQVQVSGHPAEYAIQFRKLIEQHLPQKVYAIFYESLHKFGMANLELYIRTMRFFRMVHHSLQMLEKLPHTDGLSIAFIKLERQKVTKELAEIENLHQQIRERMQLSSKLGITQACQKISDTLSAVHPNRLELPAKALKQQYESKQKLASLPSLWSQNQNLLYSVGKVELMLTSLDGIVRSVLRRLASEIQNVYSGILNNKLTELSSYLQQLQLESQSDSNLNFNPEKIDFSNINESLWVNLMTQTEAAIKEIKVAVEKLPRKLDMLSDTSFNNFHKDQFEGIEQVQVSANRLLHVMIDERVTEPLQAFMNRLPNRLQYTVNKATDIIRFISFNLQGEELDQIEGMDATNVLTMIKEQVRKVEILVDDSLQEQNKALDQIDSITNDLATQLNVYAYTRAPEKLKQYVKGYDKKTRFYGFRKFFASKWERSVQTFNQVWFRKSEALLLAQNLQDEKIPNTAVNELLNFTEKVSPKVETFTKLPFYYQQLFLRNNNDNNEFWHGREKELEEADKAIARFRSGYPGGILIVGERNSGRSSLANAISARFAEEKHIFRISAPEQGSVSESELLSTLRRALMFHGGIQQLFNNIPQESVVVFDKLELWWEKSENGMQLIYQIMNIIEQYSQRILFVVDINQHTYRLISQIFPIGNYFLSLIETGPMTAQQLYNIVLQRHRSTGMQLNYKGKDEQHISSFEYANLFTKFFSLSKGNVGIALQAWVASINEVNDNNITIVSPEEPSFDALRKIDKANFMLLLQLVLHRRLNLERLIRILREPEETIVKKINYLKRSGIVLENAKSTLSINRYVYPQVVAHLRELELL